jgi:hypothetical protein
VLFSAQPAATKRKFDKVLQGFDPWQMAGGVLLSTVLSYDSLKGDSRTAMERVTYTTKSFIIAIALVPGRITAEQAALASQVEVASQIERWGEVEDCTLVYSFVHRPRLNSDTKLTTLTTTTFDDTLEAQLVYSLHPRVHVTLSLPSIVNALSYSNRGIPGTLSDLKHI